MKDIRGGSTKALEDFVAKNLYLFVHLCMLVCVRACAFTCTGEGLFLSSSVLLSTLSFETRFLSDPRAVESACAPAPQLLGSQA